MSQQYRGSDPRSRTTLGSRNYSPADPPAGTELTGFTFPSGHAQSGETIPTNFGFVEGAIPIWSSISSPGHGVNIPDAPALEHFTGNTNVPLPPRLDQSLDNISDFSQSEGFQSLLSGKPNMGLLDAGVFTPARQQLELNTLPGVRDLYSSSPLGAGFQSGARRAAEAGAITGLANQESQIRFQATMDAQEKQLKAAALLPAFTQAYSVELQNNVLNIGRELETHFLNQGLTADEFQLQLGAITASLEAAGLDLAADQLLFEIDAFEKGLNAQLSTFSSLKGRSDINQAFDIGADLYGIYKDRKTPTSSGGGGGGGGLGGAVSGAASGFTLGNTIVPGIGGIVGGAIGGLAGLFS